MVDIWISDSLLWNGHIGYVYLPTMIPKKEPKITIPDKMIMSFDGILPINRNVKIYHRNNSKLAKHCVTLKIFFDKHFKETEYNYVIYENCSYQKWKSTRSNFDMYQSLKRPLILFRFFAEKKIWQVTM